jgi:hypothetical protein
MGLGSRARELECVESHQHTPLLLEEQPVEPALGDDDADGQGRGGESLPVACRHRAQRGIRIWPDAIRPA